MRYRIWSNEHNAWWRDSFCGYTEDINQAGVYDGLEDIKKRHPYLIGATPKDEDFLVPVTKELEDLEQMLSCPLDLYVKITQDGIWYEEDEKMYWVDPHDLFVGKEEDTIYICWEDVREIYSELKISDHMKTWWLNEDKSC